MKTLFKYCISLAITIFFGNAMAVSEADFRGTPPLGVYTVNAKSRTQLIENQNIVARLYGYANRDLAFSDCVKYEAILTRENPREVRPNGCLNDIVWHKRGKEPEIAKFGFPSWDAAVAACAKKRRQGDFYDCSYDPFILIRNGQGR